MEFRKIIAFGKSSFVVSLPKAWMVAHNLVKGDVVYLEEEDDDLFRRRRMSDQKANPILQFGNQSSNVNEIGLTRRRFLDESKRV